MWWCVDGGGAMMASVENACWERLGKAVLCQALRDALGKAVQYDRKDGSKRRREAQEWLLDVGDKWSDWCGAGVSEDDIRGLAEKGWKLKVDLSVASGRGRLKPEVEMFEEREV
jgi:hypothetical protein